jgi:hypothetical protein
MMLGKQKYPVEMEKRRYVRMRYVFPVEVHIIDKEENEIQGLYYQGFSRDVSLGGIKIEINRFDPTLIEKLINKEYKFFIKMDIPPKDLTHPAIAEVVWVSKDEKRDRYYFGVQYTKIEPAVRKELIFDAKFSRWKTHILTAVFLFLVIVSGYSLYAISMLRAKTYDLQQKNISIAQEKSFYLRQIEEFRAKEGELQKKLKESEEQIAKLDKLYKEVSADESIKAEIQKLTSEKEEIKDKLSLMEKGRAEARKQAEKIVDKQLSPLTIRSLLDWMKIKQTRNFGLIPSFSGDESLKAVSYTYDQALAAMAFSVSGEPERARKILDYYKNFAQQDENNVYYNGYYTAGQPSEYVVHVGPNTWIGIAAVQYFLMAGDSSFLQVAKNIAAWLEKFMDADGGLKGGPGVSWYSTEHNLDAYAFFDMLHFATKDEKYSVLKNRSLKWIKEHAYDAKQKRFKRGKGDSTIATDTFSWGIAAVGPETLIKENMDPFSIIDFAEENCKVTVQFKNRQGQIVEVTGFDFAKARNVGRGGVVSTEWTSQMTVAYSILSRFTQNNGNGQQSGKLREKYNFYLNELQKMLIVSSTKTGATHLCLPYASQADADTGHGWRTPSGEKTESVAGTCYYLFAIKEFNPISCRGNEKFYSVRQALIK